jgi:hypothetical protein
MNNETSQAITIIEENIKTPVEIDKNLSAMIMQQYQNASSLVLTPAESEKLLATINEDDVNIRPDGLIYLPHIFVRERLNRSLGVGQWALIENRVVEKDGTYMFDGSLYIRGCFVSRAIGEMQYHENNSKMSIATVYEGAKSDSLVRNCKDLGIGKECWQPRWSQNWVKKFGVKVWRDKQGRNKTGEFQWRHIDSLPFYDEGSPAPDSPNAPSITLASLKNKTGIKPEPKKEKAPEKIPTANKPTGDESILKELEAVTLLNDLRILFNKVTATDKKQAERLKANFTAKRKLIEDILLKVGGKEVITPKNEDLPAKPKADILKMVIDALTTETFERDITSCEALIAEVKDDIQRYWYFDYLVAKLKKIGLNKYVPKVKNIKP